MGLDNAHLGWLFAIFYYSYTLFQFAVGPVLDRFNLRWCFAIAVMAWSLVVGLTGLSAGFAESPGISIPPGGERSRQLAGRFAGAGATLPPEERTLGCGIFDGGAAVGALIAPAAIFALLSAFGWRSVFFCLGFLGLLWAPVWLLVTRGRGTLPGVDRCAGGSRGTSRTAECLSRFCWQPAILVGVCGVYYREPVLLLYRELVAHLFRSGT